MTVRVRLFASLRDAASTSETTVEADRLSDLLDLLRARYGEPFASRLAHASVLVGGEPVAHDTEMSLADGEEVVLLPPFSGGAEG
jgi:MoaD family protein